MAQVLLVSQGQKGRVICDMLRDRGMLCDMAEEISISGVAGKGYDVVIFDSPRVNRKCTDTIRQYRASGGTMPVLCLIQPNDVFMRIRALEAGADDCVAMPAVDIREIDARIRALLRRPPYVAPVATADVTIALQ
jgi:DNA-binding response OmpR family regulator